MVCAVVERVKGLLEALRATDEQRCMRFRIFFFVLILLTYVDFQSALRFLEQVALAVDEAHLYHHTPVVEYLRGWCTDSKDWFLVLKKKSCDAVDARSNRNSLALGSPTTEMSVAASWPILSPHSLRLAYLFHRYRLKEVLCLVQQKRLEISSCGESLAAKRPAIDRNELSRDDESDLELAHFSSLKLELLALEKVMEERAANSHFAKACPIFWMRLSHSETFLRDYDLRLLFASALAQGASECITFFSLLRRYSNCSPILESPSCFSDSQWAAI